MYFENFPVLAYDFDIGGKVVTLAVTDITANARIMKDVLSTITIYDEYDIREGETPEIISNKIYGSPFYHWVIMIANDRYDYLDDFPKSYKQFEDFVSSKYENVYDIHHYENEEGYVVHSSEVGAIGITNYEYENRLNEEKRRIKLIPPKLLGSILTQFKALI